MLNRELQGGSPRPAGSSGGGRASTKDATPGVRNPAPNATHPWITGPVWPEIPASLGLSSPHWF